MKTDALIASLMNIYRDSKYHNARNGKILAKILAFYNKIGKKKNAVKQINGIFFELDLNQVIDSSLYYSSTYEPKEEAIMKRYLKPGMNVIDIGANIGYHSFRMARLVNPGGFVYAIEPTGWAINKLIRNLGLNPTIRNIKIEKLALSDQSIGIRDVSFQSSYQLDNRQVLNTEKVKIQKFDDFVLENNIQNIGFIKLDVDGHEGKIIQGAAETIKKHHPMILFELNPGEIKKSGYSLEGIFDFFVSNNYQIFGDDLDPIDKNRFLSLNQNANQSSMLFAFVGNLKR